MQNKCDGDWPTPFFRQFSKPPSFLMHTFLKIPVFKSLSFPDSLSSPFFWMRRFRKRIKAKKNLTNERIITLGSYCSKSGQVNVPPSPVLFFFLIWRAIFLAREEQIYARLSPPSEREWYEYTISSCEIRNS